MVGPHLAAGAEHHRLLGPVAVCRYVAAVGVAQELVANDLARQVDFPRRVEPRRHRRVAKLGASGVVLAWTRDDVYEDELEDAVERRLQLRSRRVRHDGLLEPVDDRLQH